MTVYSVVAFDHPRNVGYGCYVASFRASQKGLRGTLCYCKKGRGLTPLHCIKLKRWKHNDLGKTKCLMILRKTLTCVVQFNAPANPIIISPTTFNHAKNCPQLRSENVRWFHRAVPHRSFFRWQRKLQPAYLKRYHPHRFALFSHQGLSPGFPWNLQ